MGLSKELITGKTRSWTPRDCLFEDEAQFASVHSSFENVNQAQTQVAHPALPRRSTLIEVRQLVVHLMMDHFASYRNPIEDKSNTFLFIVNFSQEQYKPLSQFTSEETFSFL